MQISVSPTGFTDWPQLLGMLRESFAYMDSRIDPPSSLIYPPVKNAVLLHELAPYRGEKRNLSFPLSEALPLELIGRIAVALSQEHARSAKKGGARAG